MRGKVLYLPPADFSFGGTEDVPFSPDLAKLVAPLVAENSHIKQVVVGKISLDLEQLRTKEKVWLFRPGPAKDEAIYVLQSNQRDNLPPFTTIHAIFLSEVNSHRSTGSWCALRRSTAVTGRRVRRL